MQQPQGVFIVKPALGRKGQNIFLSRDPLADARLKPERRYVVQDYIQDPLLVGGYKFDLRVYVLVTSFSPLVVHVFDEGIARFSTSKYTGVGPDSDLSNAFAHLTNTSVNHSNAHVEKDVIGKGCRWSLKQLRAHVEAEHGVHWPTVWRRVTDVVLLTLLPLAQQLKASSVGNPHCFEVFGFDVMFDRAFKAYLIEVNCSPCMDLACTIDFHNKLPLVHEMLSLLGFPATETQSEQVQALRVALDAVDESDSALWLQARNKVLKQQQPPTAYPVDSTEESPHFKQIMPFNGITRKFNAAVARKALGMRVYVDKVATAVKRSQARRLAAAAAVTKESA
jgi:hypothetical protein